MSERWQQNGKDEIADGKPSDEEANNGDEAGPLKGTQSTDRMAAGTAIGPTGAKSDQ